MPAALVTGSAKGIGQAVLLSLAEKGYDVAVHYRSSRAEAESVAEEARRLGVRAVVLQADVSQESQATALVHEAHQALGGLDVLVNNVGNYHKEALETLQSTDWHAMFDSNLHSTFYTCQCAAALMRQAGAGRIINLGFAGAEVIVARPAIVAYHIAKTGVILYSKSLAKSEAKYGITVNVISPGVMDNSDSKPHSELPMQRTGKLSELCAALHYLLSPEAAYVTGVTLEIAGGWNL